MRANSETTAVLAAELRTHRNAARLSQRQLAERANVSVETVQNLELGRSRRPRSEHVARLAQALGVAFTAGPREPAHTDVSAGAAGAAGEQDIASRPADLISVQLLGPLRVGYQGRDLALGPLAQRSVLGLLALELGAEVRRETITDSIWGSIPPPSAVNMVQKYFGRLRRVFDSCHGEVLVSTGTSYQMKSDRVELDLLDFQRLVKSARETVSTGDTETGCDLYHTAVAMWRGDPLEDIDILQEHPVVVGLARLRATTILEYAEAAAGTYLHESALHHLHALVRRDPLNERAFAQLMLMLAAMGEQAAALDAFDKIRQLLNEQLGIRPSRVLADAQLRVLRQDVPAPVALRLGAVCSGYARGSARRPGSNVSR